MSRAPAQVQVMIQGVVAYFSMEIAREHRIPTYSGGLGVLAGTRYGPRPTSGCRWSA